MTMLMSNVRRVRGRKEAFRNRFPVVGLTLATLFIGDVAVVLAAVAAMG
jgi:hypothetical protein